ncbi:hypothetical protein [Paludisphaera mucosa]|uniref:Uncharacterized protein n=1 Tax=Paludisphaera mucosa TaxID=3030827 RepID=A0ABT6FJ84_9BACT|nr:hypothetical protein [Paludisphaera mucosa]MDG3007614.1 hypothetical protein [Paludisphaera mucosa]
MAEKRATKAKAGSRAKTKAAGAKSKSAPSKAKVAGPKPASDPKPMKEQAGEPGLRGREVEPGAEGPVLERGDLFFFYRPDVDEAAPQGLVDVRRFHVVLRPEGGDGLRLITVGRKTLPEAADEGRSHWAFVDRIFDAPDALREALAGSTYETETVGERTLPEARPAGEGSYALVRHGRSTILAYALAVPEEPGEVQRAFHIEREGRFALAVKNPEAGSPAGVGLEEDRRVEFPEELQNRFGSRRWSPVDPPAFLDHEGAELVLIGGREAAEDLGVDLELDAEPRDEDDAEVFRELHLDKSDRTIRPLFEGDWS